MEKKFSLFLIGFLISFVFFGLINLFSNNLSNSIFKSEISETDISLDAQKKNLQNENLPINTTSQAINTISQENILEPNFTFKAALGVKFYPNSQEELILYEKNSHAKLPIASLTKLMTALIVQEFYKEDFKIRVNKLAINQEEAIGQLKVGEYLRVSDLLKIMLLESSNDAAFALSEAMGQEGFVYLMNKKAQELGMSETMFFNSTGIDNSSTTNYSTCFDLYKLAKEIVKNQKIIEILSEKEYPLYLENGKLHHKLLNTNLLLGEIPEIIAGKTGYTKEAKGCLLEILKSQDENGDFYLFTIVLGSDDRFQDTRELIKFLNQKYKLNLNL